MYNTHPTILNQNSRFYNESAKLACIYHDITAKLTILINQSAPEQVIRVWVIASSGVRRDGRIVFIKSHADAETSRGFGRIIKQPTKLCECGFIPIIKNRIRTEQRARRWRAACTLIVYEGTSVDTAETYITLEWSAKAPEKLYI